jgi:ribosomal protein L16/L10AE
MKNFKKTNKFLINLKPYYPLTKKSTSSRMGKGKGKVYSNITLIQPGQIPFKIKGPEIKDTDLKYLKITKDKIAFKIKYIC